MVNEQVSISERKPARPRRRKIRMRGLGCYAKLRLPHEVRKKPCGRRPFAGSKEDVKNQRTNRKSGPPHINIQNSYGRGILLTLATVVSSSFRIPLPCRHPNPKCLPQLPADYPLLLENP